LIIVSNKKLLGSGFTLIELLIVVAIIGILASIAIPNFLSAQIKSRIAKAYADMDSLGKAIESYYIDKDIYPVMVYYMGMRNETPQNLTSPIPYMTYLPKDPFNKNKEDYLYTWWTYSELGSFTGYWLGWYISSYGPDEKGPDIKFGLEQGKGPVVLPESAYDMNRGIRSEGDLFKCSPSGGGLAFATPIPPK